MRGKVVKRLRRLANRMADEAHRNEVVVTERKKVFTVPDPTSMLGFKMVHQPVNIRTHHPKSAHSIMEGLKKSYRQYRKDGSPNERGMVSA